MELIDRQAEFETNLWRKIFMIFIVVSLSSDISPLKSLKTILGDRIADTIRLEGWSRIQESWL